MPDRIPLAFLPTPIHRLDRVSAEIGADVWIKRDDLTGLALGGNKVRKLEYLLAEAVSQRADVVVTCGAAQSNFIRQLGAACGLVGMGCAAAVMDLPYERPSGPSRRLDVSQGNVLLDRLFDVELRRLPDGTWEELYGATESLAREKEELGLRVYRIPIGGSSPLGALAFYEAAKEVPEGFDWIVTASSSGSTQTGLAHAFTGSPTRVLGIASDPEPELVDEFAKLGEEMCRLTGGTPLPPERFELNCDFVGPGYGVPSEAGDRAIRKIAALEGILLDPIYSGKAFAALLSLVSQGELKGRLLFWHTGGIPALFAHTGILMGSIQQ